MTDKDKIKEEIESYKESMKGLEPHSDFRRGQITAYNQIMQFIDSLPEEPASEDLEEEVSNWRHNHFHGRRDKDASGEYLERKSQLDLARHFAEWQNHQMKETLQTEYEKGRFDMIEEMTKDAVEGTIKYEIGSAEIPQCDKRYQVLSDPAPIANAKLGDKVKIVVLKTE